MANSPIGKPITTQLGLQIEVFDAGPGLVLLVLNGQRVGLDGHHTRLDVRLELGPFQASEAEELGDRLLRAAGWASVGAGSGLEAALVKVAQGLELARRPPESISYIVEPPAAPDPNACPTTGDLECLRCSGEFCDRHGLAPCDCDTAERHGG